MLSEHAGEMKVIRAAELCPGFDQPLMDRVELVGALRNDVAFDGLFEPRPLEHGGLEDRGRRVGIVFEQLCRMPPVEAEIDATVEAELVVMPALGNQVPVAFGYLQPAQIPFVVDGFACEFEAHGVDLAGRRLDLALDLIKRKGIIGALIPVGLAVDGVEVEAGRFGGRAPVVALGTGDALHGPG